MPQDSTGDAAHAQAVRLARAEAQVTGILIDRTREALRAPERRAATEETLRAVAAHELDPYAAADDLVASLRLEGAAPVRSAPGGALT